MITHLAGQMEYLEVGQCNICHALTSEPWLCQLPRNGLKLYPRYCGTDGGWLIVGLLYHLDWFKLHYAQSLFQLTSVRHIAKLYADFFSWK